MPELYKSLGNIDQNSLGNLSFLLIDRLQCHPPEVQAAALSVVFIMYCGMEGINPADVHEYVRRAVVKDDGSMAPVFRAIQEYMHSELRDPPGRKAFT